ncbi:MAG: hypothetical protein ACKV2T_05475 [Kofleriaceae bacterium]
MLGKLVGRPARAVAFLGVASLLASCAHNVAQDKSSGEDAKIKGAKELVLENGEAKGKGIVTYPGGDRVDWKKIELPENQKGTLDIKLAWTTPRPNLQLAFDVFDAWNTPIISSSKSNKKRSRGRTKSASIEKAKGTYFIRVYAVNRGDAGAYKLTVEFKEQAANTGVDWAKVEIAEPPRLAEVPPPLVPCDPLAFDPKNLACQSVCPDVGAPPGWPACKDKCPAAAPDINNPACQKSMPCPNPPDRRVASCKKSMWPKCNLAAKDPMNPNCDDAKADPVTARVLRQETQGQDIIITVGAGSNSGVEKSWRAQVLRGDSGEPLGGGDVAIIRVDKQATVGRVRLTADQIKQNDKVKLSPP